jgi:hypothetical protein
MVRVSVHVSDEHYQMFRQEQAARLTRGERCSISELAAEALAGGMYDVDGEPYFGPPPVPRSTHVLGPMPVDTGRLKNSLTANLTRNG